MFTLSKFHLSSFWIILFIVVHSQCYNDSTVWFNYGDLEYVNNPRIEDAASTVIEWPSTVDLSPDPLGFLPDPTSEPAFAAPGLPPSSTTTQSPDEQDFSVTPDILDTDSQTRDLERLTHPQSQLTAVTWSNRTSSWIYYQDANSERLRDPENGSLSSELGFVRSLQHGALATRIDSDGFTSPEEDIAPQPDVPSIDMVDSSADREQHTPIISHEEVPRNVTLSGGDLDPSQPTNSSRKRPADDGSSSAASGDEPPGGSQRSDFEDLWIKHRRKHARLQPKDDVAPWRPRSPEHDPPRRRRRFWSELGTAAAAASTLALLSETERRRKRERSTSAGDRRLARTKFWVEHNYRPEKVRTSRRPTTLSAREPEKLVTCLTCLSDDIPRSKSAKLKCGHRMCDSCLKRLFKLSISDPQYMPPKCCTRDFIPLKHVDRLFDAAFKKTWNRKFVEYSTKNRIYCPARRCGEWIKPSNIHKDNGVKYGKCSRCKMKVCCQCNGKWHGSKDCPKDEETNLLLEIAKQAGWQRCYSCQAMVELKEGSNHMTCRCTAEFCMICGLQWKSCNCPWFNYEAVEADRLNHMEEDAEDVPGRQERRRRHRRRHSPNREYHSDRQADAIHNPRKQKEHYQQSAEDQTSSRRAASTRPVRVVYVMHRDTPATTTTTLRPHEPKKSRRNQNTASHHKAQLVTSREQLSEKYDILLQPEKRKPLSQEMLVEEVESIYEKLVKVEEKCIEVNSQQATLARADRPQPQLNNEHWQALIALHGSLLEEYHDFFSTSQHPSASPAVRHLAWKYAMPARIRRHGITNFFELLRQRLPTSQEHMMAFIHQSYSMMALLYETVPAFEYTWINCLADIARYRAFIEDGDTKDRDVWAGLAEHWSSKAAAKSREIRGLPLPNLTQFADNIHQKIAGFLCCEDLIQLSLSSKKLHAVYKPALAEILRIRQERKAAELREQWTTRATLALPLDEEELVENMGTSMVTTSSDPINSLPSTMMQPLETTDDWLFSFMNLDFISEDEGSNKTGPLPLIGNFQEMIPAKQMHIEHPLSSKSLHIPSYLTVMISEDNGQSPHDDEEHNSDDEEMSIDEENDTTELSQSDIVSKFSISVAERSSYTQDHEKKGLEFATPPMTDIPTTIESSPESKASHSIPGLQTSSRAGTGTYTCPQCPYSCPRKCDLRKHAKYHIKDLHCSMPNCKESFSRKQDLVRHEKSLLHQNGTEQHYCPHPECRAKNKKPFTRKDNMTKHWKKMHSQDKIEEAENEKHMEEDEHEEEDQEN